MQINTVLKQKNNRQNKSCTIPCAWINMESESFNSKSYWIGEDKHVATVKKNANKKRNFILYLKIFRWFCGLTVKLVWCSRYETWNVIKPVNFVFYIIFFLIALKILFWKREIPLFVLYLLRLIIIVHVVYFKFAS